MVRRSSKRDTPKDIESLRQQREELESRRNTTADYFSGDTSFCNADNVEVVTEELPDDAEVMPTEKMPRREEPLNPFEVWSLNELRVIEAAKNLPER